jgi:hypothetical protein
VLGRGVGSNDGSGVGCGDGMTLMLGGGVGLALGRGVGCGVGWHEPDMKRCRLDLLYASLQDSCPDP